MGKQLITRADYARQANLSRARITQLVQAGVIVLHRGLVDPVEADRSRQERVAPRMRGPACTVHIASAPDLSWMDRLPICAGCGGRFGSDIAVQLNSPDPKHFCSDLCFDDICNGFTPAQVADRRYNEAPED